MKTVNAQIVGPGDGAVKRAEGRTPRRWAVASLVALLPLAACDFTVTNPGPIQDEFLNGPLAYGGILAGVQRMLMDAHYEIDKNGASGMREIFPAGNAGPHGVNSAERQGVYTSSVTSAYWNQAQAARWLAEDGAARLKASMSAATYASSVVAGTVALWAGYANRHMGETFCEAVIDGGPLLPNSEYFTRAEGYFTDALAIFTAANSATLRDAARAGRASVRAHLNRWAEAVADAGLVPNSAVYKLQWYDLEENQWNTFVSATVNQPFRTLSTWNTFYEGYFRTTGDPRVEWITFSNQPFGSQQVSPYGNIPFYRPYKFKLNGDGTNLSSGREMRLIEAEGFLQAGNFASALATINSLRSSVTAIARPGITVGVVNGAAMPPWTAVNLVEAGTAFKKEHGIELWLEGRRMGARARWTRQSLPGDLTIYEVPSTTIPAHGLGPTGGGTLLSANMTTCMAVPDQERQLNPNIPD